MSGNQTDRDPEAAVADGGGRGAGRRVVVAVVILCLAWLAIGAVQIASAAFGARSGVEAMEGLRDSATGSVDELVDSVGGDVDDIAEEDAAGQLEAAASEFGGAADSLGSVWVAPYRLLPWAGRQVRSAAALAESAETVAGEASVAVAELEDVLAGSSATGPTRLAAVQRSSDALARFEQNTTDLDLGPEEDLVGPLANARSRFSEEYEQVTGTLESMSQILLGVESLLGGDGRYLVLGANNAEMRAGSGMLLQAAPLEVEGGDFSVGDFEATENLTLAEPVPVVDPDIEQLWGSFAPYRDFRNTNMSPRFDQTGRATAAMWEAQGRIPVQGVIAVDVPALEALLELTGPVVLPSGETVSAESISQDLLVDQYVAFGDRDARRERVGQVAKAVFEALNTNDVSASELLRVLRDLGAARHLLIWSSDEVEQQAWVELGVSGVPTEDSMLLSVMNRGGNKLDPYLEVDPVLSIEEVDGVFRFRVSVGLRNGAPEGLPNYVAGPYPGTGFVEGEYRGIVALTMPGGAGNVTMQGGVPVALGDDGPTRVAAAEITLGRGEATLVDFEFQLPTTWESVEVLSSARVPASQWSGVVGPWEDSLPKEIDLTGPA